MSDLTNTFIDDAYHGLLHANATALPSTGQQIIYDGNGNASSLSLGQAGNGATICGTLTVDDLQLNLKSLMDVMWPIGSVYFTASNNNNGQLFGGVGTWVLISQGKYITGHDSTTYSDEEYYVTLNTSQIVTHTHTCTTPILTFNGGTNLAGYLLYNFAGTDTEYGMEVTTSSAPAYYTSSVGSGLPHSNISPAYGVYCWQRIA